eukprot:s1562_g9.t1
MVFYNLDKFEMNGSWRATNYVTKPHYGASDREFTPTVDSCSIELKYLTMQEEDHEAFKLAGDPRQVDLRLQGYDWTGYTCFKIHTTWRRQAYKEFYDKSQGTDTICVTEDKKPRTVRAIPAKFIFNWKKDDNGGKRAKARLSCQGFRDPDALNSMDPSLLYGITNLISITSVLGCIPFTADITTAFLQGKKYDPDSHLEKVSLRC